MNKQEYNELIKELSEHRKGVSDGKRKDYTKGSDDVLANFKNVAKSTGVSPLQVWLVYTQKHFDAIANYIKTEGESESEPIKERFGDVLNYFELGWALVNEENPDYVLAEEVKAIHETDNGFDVYTKYGYGFFAVNPFVQEVYRDGDIITGIKHAGKIYKINVNEKYIK